MKENQHQHHGCQFLSLSTRCQLYQPLSGYYMSFFKQSWKVGFSKQVLEGSLAQSISSVTIS